MPYPPIPAPRIEYDRDGTRVYYYVLSNPVPAEFSPTWRAALADESDSTMIGDLNSPYAIFWVFPELRDIEAIFAQIPNNPTTKVEWSTDSVTGVDGTWTEAVASLTEATLIGQYRDDITPLTGIVGAKFLRVTCNPASFATPRAIHLYGTVSTGQTVHRLRLWHPTLDEPLDDYPAHFDWGNIPQGTDATKQFRVKNDSPTLDASGITCFMQSLTDATPTQVSQHTLSLDDATYVASATPGVTVPDLVAQAISAPIFLKRTTSVSAQLGLWRQRLVAGAATWV